MSQQAASASGGSTLAVNRAKQWQIALFPFNNAATNVYFAFYNYFVYWAVLYLSGSTAVAIGGVLVSAGTTIAISAFTGIFAPLMRVFDGITDPILGGILDKTKTKFGKFRPFMVIGNVMLAFSVLLMMVIARFVPNDLAPLQWTLYIVSYIIYVLGYTCQCAVTKAGQTCLTNDPKQRSQFVIWNMIGMIGSIVLVNVMAGGVLTNPIICDKGLIISVFDQYEENALTMTELIKKLTESGIDFSGVADQLSPDKFYKYNSGASYGIEFYNIMVPFVIIVSAIYTIMAVAAISEKDKPEFWGVSEKPAKMKDYLNIIKENKEIRWLVLSSGLNKLASTVATSGTVAFLVYGCLMGDYNGLFIPFYALCFVFMGLFFLWGSNTAGRKGQKRGVAQFTVFALIFYIGVLILLCVYNHENPATYLSIFKIEDGKFSLTINAYTILFIIFYGCGYGAFNCCDNLTIPMIADCTDYETYRSGNYVPGIMGTIFSLVDKLISSLQVLLLQLFIVILGPYDTLPAESSTYVAGAEVSAIICFCILPMVAWAVTVFCMTRYGLSGKKLQEIQAVNAVRKAAVSGGMSMEQAMETWKTIDQVPAAFVYNRPPRINKKTGEVIVEKENILDKIYNVVFTRHEKVSGVPSSNAIDIPEEYLTDEVRAQIEASSAKAETVAESVANDDSTEKKSDESSES